MATPGAHGAAALLVMVLGCAPATVPLRPEQYPDAGARGPGYRFENLAGGADANRLFVCLAFSGGGTRAAALAYGAMLALRQTRLDWPHPGSSLLNEVDCISSVSGGSFTAAYYARFHDDLFRHFEDRFLRRNVQARLALATLWPWNWLRLASPYFSRIDLAAEVYDRLVFQHATYDDLVQSRRRPFVVLNATNLATGRRFPFTQPQFDLIGSELGPVPLARAVAASSAFPFLLSPLTLMNHQPLADFTAPTEYRMGLDDYYVNRNRYYWSQAQLAYVDEPAPYVHLMDGGLADNVGLRTILHAYEQSNEFIGKNLPDIERLVIIAVNARTESADGIGRHRHTPHIVPTVAMATATISMDNYSFESVDAADELMRSLRQAKLTNANIPGAPVLRAPTPYVIEISFEAIPDPALRKQFYGVGTSFHLPDAQVQALVAMGCELLKQDPVFRCLLADLERAAAGGDEAESACDDDVPDAPRAAEQIVCPAAGAWPRSP